MATSSLELQPTCKEMKSFSVKKLDFFFHNFYKSSAAFNEQTVFLVPDRAVQQAARCTEETGYAPCKKKMFS